MCDAVVSKIKLVLIMLTSVYIISVLCLWCTESTVMVCKNQTEITNLTSLQLPSTSYINGESYDCSCSINSATGQSIILSIERIPRTDCFVILYENSTDHFHSNNSTNVSYTLEGDEKVYLKLKDCWNTSGQNVLLNSQNGDMNISCHGFDKKNGDFTTQSIEDTTISENSNELERHIYARILGGSIGGAILIFYIIIMVLCIVKHKEHYLSGYRKQSIASSSHGEHSSARRSSSVSTVAEQIESIPHDEGSDTVFKDMNDKKVIKEEKPLNVMPIEL